MNMNILKYAVATVCVAISLFMTGQTAMARDFDGGLLWGLKGDVKNVSLKSDLKKAFGKVSFNKDGKIKNRLMSYDASGRPIGYGMNNGDTYLYMNVWYNTSGDVEKVRLRNRTDSKMEEVVLEFRFKYDGKELSEVEATDSEAPDARVIYRFSGYEYDDAGNWLKRDVEVDGYTPGGDSKKRTTVETRKIKYY